MKTDPRAACANATERKAWALFHDFVAHPLMALTNWSRAALWLHDRTSERAWPRVGSVGGDFEVVPNPTFGPMLVRYAGLGQYAVTHPEFQHTIIQAADDPLDAAERAEQWFATLLRADGVPQTPDRIPTHVLDAYERHAL